MLAKSGTRYDFLGWEVFQNIRDFSGKKAKTGSWTNDEAKDLMLWPSFRILWGYLKRCCSLSLLSNWGRYIGCFRISFGGFFQVHCCKVKRGGLMEPPSLSEQNRKLVKQRTGYINSQCCEKIVSDDGRVTSPSSLTRRSRLIKPQRRSNSALRVIIAREKTSAPTLFYFFLFTSKHRSWIYENLHEHSYTIYCIYEPLFEIFLDNYLQKHEYKYKNYSN